MRIKIGEREAHVRESRGDAVNEIIIEKITEITGNAKMSVEEFDKSYKAMLTTCCYYAEIMGLADRDKIHESMNECIADIHKKIINAKL